MTIPIDPALIARAVPIGPLGQAIPLLLCKMPAEGLKVVNFQVTPLPPPINSSVTLIDMLQGSPNPPLSQVGSIFLDASGSSADVTILFADTGYQVRIAAGDSALFPAITGIAYPKFYIIFGPEASTGIDVANIFVLNQFVPEFNSTNFIKATSYGIIPGNGASIELGPILAQTSTVSKTDIDLTGSTSPHLSSNIYSDTELLDGMELYLDVQSNTTSRFNVIIIGQGNLPPGQIAQYFSFPVLADTTRKIIRLCELTGLKMQTVDDNSINVYIDNNTNLDICLLSANLQGDGLF